MNAVVTNRVISISRRAWMVSGFLVLMLFCAGIQAFDRGPLHCASCGLGAPDIDANTKGFLESKLVAVDGYVPFWMYLTKTTYTICNATHCATYYQTFDGDYMTKGKVPRDQPGGGGLGSGSGNPGGGGQGGGNGGGAVVAVAAQAA